MPTNLLSILGTIGGVAGQAIANQQNAQQNALNRQHELYMLGQQQQWAAQQAAMSDMRQRALYNDLQSPDAIRRQLEKAGLSIGLMYGQGGMGGQMTSGAQADSPAAQNRGTIPMQNVFDAQIAAILADAKLKEAQTEKTESETEVNKQELPVLQQQIETMKQGIRESEQRIEQSKAEVNKIGEQIINLAADTKLKGKYEELAQAQKEVQEAVKKWQESQTRLSQIDEQTRGEFNQTQIEEMKTSIKEHKQNTATLAALAKKYASEAEANEIQNSLNKYTYMDQAKIIIYNAAIKEMEKGTFMKGKKIEWDKAKAEIDKAIEDAYEKGSKNDFYRGLENWFGPEMSGQIRMWIEDVVPW